MSFPIDRRQFLNIVNQFSQAPESAVITASQADGSYHYAVTENRTIYNPSETIGYLQSLIGKERLYRIFQHKELNLNHYALNNNTLIVTKDIFRRIFYGIAYIQHADVDQLPDSALPPLVPFQDLHEFKLCFLGTAPSIENFTIDRARSSGKGLKGFVERIFILWTHHFSLSTPLPQTDTELRDTEFLCSRISDREMRIGDVIPLSDGYHIVDRIFVRGGTYIAVLKNRNGTTPPKIVCRGTAMRPNATGWWKSGLNNIIVVAGTMGILRVWSDLSSYLQTEDITTVDIFGKSLGGAFAQLLTLLFEIHKNAHVKHLTTLCSIGIGSFCTKLFNTYVAQRDPQHPLRLHIIRNGGDSNSDVDHIPTIGGVHFGKNADPTKCTTTVTYMKSGSGPIHDLIYNTNPITRLFRFLTSFRKPHCTQSTLTNFSWKQIPQHQIQQHLSTGNFLEPLRKIIAYSLLFFAFLPLTILRINLTSLKPLLRPPQ